MGCEPCGRAGIDSLAATEVHDHLDLWTLRALSEKDEALQVQNSTHRSSVSIGALQALNLTRGFWLPVKTYRSREELGAQWKHNLADAAAPNSWHRIPEGSPAICNATPTSSQYTC
ncbi:uncharacterized protein V6R79_019224 [Siganus canaliculatus]